MSDPEPVLAETASAQAVDSERTPPEPEPERASEPRPAPAEVRKRSKVGTWAAALLASAAIGGGGAWWLLNQYGPGAEVSALKQRLAGTESRIESMSRELAECPKRRWPGLDRHQDVRRPATCLPRRSRAEDHRRGRWPAGRCRSAQDAGFRPCLGTRRLETALTEMKSAISAAGQGGSAGAVSADVQLKVGELAKRLDELSAKLAAVPAAGAGDVKAALDHLTTRLDAMDKRLNEGLEASKASAAAPKAVVDAVAALEAKLGAGTAFDTELSAAMTALPAAAGLADLKPFAATGIPTLETLKASFAPVVAAVTATGSSEPAEPAESSTWDLVKARLASVVKVRHRSEVEWPDAVTEASRQLDENDLAGAVATLSKPANPPPAVIDWLKGANARIEADQAIRATMEQALRQMSGNAN